MPEVAEVPTFHELFGGEPLTVADAPGRVNLIGEHTDYHEGFVLPCAIPQRTRVELRPRADTRVRVWSAERPERIAEFSRGFERRSGGWIDYLAGITAILDRRGMHVPGYEARIVSTVPVGAGLSSSAALEVAVLRALRDALALALTDVDLARLAQQAEIDFVGAPVGIMDQFAASLATEREALFLDTRTLEYIRVPIPPEVELGVIDSGVEHRHASGGYKTRRAESEEAARQLGVRVLRDASERDLPRLSAISPVLARRARHVITENARVLAFAEALPAGRTHELGTLFNASHASMRDDYDVSIADVDALVETCRDVPEVFGARMTGGGFGGCVVALISAGHGANATAHIAQRYGERTNRTARVLIPPPP